MALIPTFYNDAVVAIGKKENEQIKWLATGFVVARKNENGGYNTFLVTNKHVLECGFDELIIRFNIVGKLNAQDYPINLKDSNGNKLYSIHPNHIVDVASIMIDAQTLAHDLGAISAFELDDMTLTYEDMIENEVVEGSLVYSLGFPSGLVGIRSKMPLCRLGCISKISEKTNDEGYLLDIQNFPGSSGSPVINRLECNSLADTKCFNSTRLIGILAAYIPYEDILVSQQTGKAVQVNQENSGIAVVYNVNAIKKVVEVEFERVRILEKSVQANKKDPIMKEKNT